MQHSVYASIVNSVKCKKLVEPFTVQDFKRACPGFGAGTYNAFLYKHRQGNLGDNSELFELVSKGKFSCIRPFKYGL
jgi:hypothetical protein